MQDQPNLSRRAALSAGLATAAVLGSARTVLAQDATTGGDGPLAGKAVIVTGARNNLGRAFSAALAGDGADVVVHYHREATRGEAEETAGLVRDAGGRAELVAGDLGDPDRVAAVFDACEQAFGKVDGIVNTVGTIKKVPMAELELDDLERQINANTRATFLINREAARRVADDGRIVNIGTSLLAGGAPGYASYAGTKACMEEITRCLPRELADRRITVNCIGPGPLDNAFFWGQENEQSGAYAAGLSMEKRLGTEADIVPVVRFLCRPDAQWVNGQTLWVNGGYLTR